MTPEKFASDLRRIASHVLASKKPDMDLVIDDLIRLVAAAPVEMYDDDEEEYTSLLLDSTVDVGLHYGEIATAVYDIENALRQAGATDVEFDHDGVSISFPKGKESYVYDTIAELRSGEFGELATKLISAFTNSANG